MPNRKIAYAILFVGAIVCSGASLLWLVMAGMPAFIVLISSAVAFNMVVGIIEPSQAPNGVIIDATINVVVFTCLTGGIIGAVMILALFLAAEPCLGEAGRLMYPTIACIYH